MAPPQYPEAKMLRVIYSYAGNFEDLFEDETLVTKAYTIKQQVEFRTIEETGNVQWKYKGEEEDQWKVLLDSNSLPKFTFKIKEW